MQTVFFKKIHPDAKTPVRGSAHSVGYDLSSVEEMVLKAGSRALVSTGLELAGALFNFDIALFNFDIQIRPRSGLAYKHGVTVLNSPGTVDPDYRGEVKVLLINHSDKDYKISKGDRIAQMVFARFEAPAIALTEDKTSTSRGSGGFGSTGA